MLTDALTGNRVESLARHTPSAVADLSGAAGVRVPSTHFPERMDVQWHLLWKFWTCQYDSELRLRIYLPCSKGRTCEKKNDHDCTLFGGSFPVVRPEERRGASF